MSPWMTERLNALRTENQPERPALRIPAPRPEPARRPEREPHPRRPLGPSGRLGFSPAGEKRQGEPQPRRGVTIVDLTIS